VINVPAGGDLAAAIDEAQPGDTLELAAGGEYALTKKLSVWGKSGEPGRPITLSSDPSRRAKLILPAAETGVELGNSSWWTIENLILEGPGAHVAEKNKDCIQVMAYGTRVEGIILRNIEASGCYRGVGVMAGTPPGDLVSGVIIENGDFHHNLDGGGFTWADEIGGVENMIVRDSRFHNNLGDPALGSPSGNGFVFGGSANSLIERSIAHHNGGHGKTMPGPVGIWAYWSKRITIQFNEAHHNLAKFQDGDGFDLDIGVTDSVLQYNYAHDNWGAGFLMCQGDHRPWGNNIIRYNISENDGTGKRMGGTEYYIAPSSSPMNGSWFYGNTVFNALGPAFQINFQGPGATGHKVFNNIFMTGNGHPVVVNPGNPITPETLALQGNLYWASGAQVSIAGHATLEALRDATGQELFGAEALGQVADPLLTQPGSGGTMDDVARLPLLTAYRLKSGSPAIDAGLDPTRFGVPPAPRDFFGHALSKESLDVGAHEAQ
jgi:hypothetical protein